MSNPVTIPKERQQYLVDFFQKLDRMMTGLPIKVIIKNLERSKTGDATTDGKRVWMDWQLLSKPLTTEARLGINYQQVAHCFYGDPRFDREIEANLSLAANILLDCRDETLFGMMYPSVVPYLISSVQETVMKGRDLTQCQDVWPMIYGRKYLPQPARFVCMPQNEDPNLVRKIVYLIDEFVALPPERHNVPRMLELTKEFAEYLKVCKVPVTNPGGGKLIRSSRKIDNDISPSVVRRINVTLKKDRKYLKGKVRIVKSVSKAKGSTSTDNLRGGTNRLIEDDTITKVTIVEVEGDKRGTGYDSTTRAASGPDVVEVDERTAPREDSNLATDYTGGGGGSGGTGAGGANGNPLQAVLLEDDTDDAYTRYEWVGSKLEASWAKGSARLDHYKDTLTTSDVRDLVQALEAEVLFDTDQLKKAGWEGCGAVNAKLRDIRNGFDRELKLASRTLKQRFAAGRRGNVSMKLAMKAERLPDVNIFSSDTTYLDHDCLDVELVMLCDASGSMQQIIGQAMKAQWVIGSAYEARGAKVTIIPFNNVARDPLKGRDDKFSDRIYPACKADGGTQPHGALTAAKEIFDRAGSRFKMLFILTDGAWNSADLSHKLIESLNYNGVLTTLVFLGGDGRDYSNINKTRYHHCTEGFRINSIDELLPKMRNTFFRTFNKAIIRTLRRYY